MIKKFCDIFEQEESYKVSKNDEKCVLANSNYKESMDKLRETLDDNQNKLLDALCDSISNLLSAECNIYFESGFKIGANFIMEIKR